MFVVLFVVFLKLFNLFTSDFLLFSYLPPQIGGQGGKGGGVSSEGVCGQYGSGGCPGNRYDITVDSLPQVLRPGSGGGEGAGNPAGYGKGGAGGAGGASIKLHALQDITINGIITVNGDDGGLGVFENGWTK